MTSQLDTNLSLIYKNMVGFNNIYNDNLNNADFINKMTVNSNISIGNQCVFTNSLSINSDLIISGSTYFNMPMSIPGFLNIFALSVNGSSTINNNLNIANFNIANNLNINNSCVVNGSTTFNSQLNIPGNAYFKNKIYVNDFISNDFINLNAQQIILGNNNTTLNIYGTSISVINLNTLFVDKFISLNINTIQDIGSLCGIEIMGINSNGFLKTSDDASRFIIKSPLLNSPINYITVQDSNNNLIISGTSILNNNTNIISYLNISGISILNNSTTINSCLYNSGSNINSSCLINGSLNISQSGSTIINNNCSINSFLNISESGNTIINDKCYINKSLNIIGKTIIGNISINSSLYLNGIININNSTSIISNLFISGSSILNNSVSSYSLINISNNSLTSKTINSNFLVSGFSILNNTTINSSLNISSSAVLSLVTINSNVNISGQIIANLLNYNFTNNSDAKNAGIPVWGFYRTGGILKIRLNDVLPIVSLSGSSSMNVYLGSNFIDPGAYSLDFQNYSNNVYLTSIDSSSSSTILNILITGTSTLVTTTSILSNGSYTATYSATDSCSNIGYNYRLINIFNNNKNILYNSNNIYTTYNNPLVFANNNMYDNQNQNVMWSISSASLSINNFNYNDNWTLIMSMSLISNPYIYFSFDSSQANWGTQGSNGYGTSNYEVAFDFRNSGSVIINANSRGQGVNWIGLNNIYGNYSINNYINSNFYLIISYRTSSQSNTINIDFVTPNGINFLSWPSIMGISSAPIQYSNYICPVGIYHEFNTQVNYYNGILLNNHGTSVTYLDYRSLFI